MHPRQSRVPGVFDETDDCECPERTLMLAVIVNAVQEATGRHINASPAGRETIIKETRRWFEVGGPDFQLVCHAAGLEPAAVRKAALEYIAYKDANPRRKRAA